MITNKTYMPSYQVPHQPISQHILLPSSSMQMQNQNQHQLQWIYNNNTFFYQPTKSVQPQQIPPAMLYYSQPITDQSYSQIQSQIENSQLSSPAFTDSHYYSSQEGVKKFTSDLWEAIRKPDPNGTQQALNLLKLYVRNTTAFKRYGFDINQIHTADKRDYKKFQMMKNYLATRKNTLVSHAATHNKFEVIEFLVSKVTDPKVNLKKRHGHHESMLEYGVYNNNIKIVNLALRNGVEPHRRLDARYHNKYRTAMINAMELGYSEIVNAIAEKTLLSILRELH